MKHLMIILWTAFSLTGCASVNPFGVPEGKGAYLQNREEFKGESYFVYEFKSAITATGDERFEPDMTTAAYDARYQIPPGEMTLGLKILYYPNRGPMTSVGEALSTTFKMFYSGEAWSRFDDATTLFEIWIFNPKEKKSGLEGIRLQAIEGETYQIDCNIEGGKAYVWIEDRSGEKVTEIARGLGVTKHNEGFLWENLPTYKH